MKKWILIIMQWVLCCVALSSLAQMTEVPVMKGHVDDTQRENLQSTVTVKPVQLSLAAVNRYPKGNLRHMMANKQITHLSTDKPIFVKADDPVVRVTLSSNPTTGYRWILSSLNDHLVQPVSSVFSPPANKKMMGASGTVTWTFKVLPAAFKVPYLTKIELIYTRPWDLSSAEHKVIKLVT